MLKLITFLFTMTAFCFNLQSQVDTCIYYKSGELRYRGTMCDGFKCGDWFEFDKNQNKIRRLEFEGGNTCTIYQLGYDSTVNEYCFGYFDDSLVQQGSYYREYKNHNYIVEGKWWNNKILNQSSYIQFKDTTKNLRDNYVFILFNESGNIQNFCHQKNGMLNGYYISFDENNVLIEFGNFCNDAMCGDWWFYKNGKLSCRGSYYPDYLTYKVNAGQQGVEIVNKDGIRADKLYSMDFINSYRIEDTNYFPIKDGPWIYFNTEGIPIKEEFYKKGDLLWSVEY